MKKFRLKIEHTKEYQAKYSSHLVNAAQLAKKLEKTLKREIWEDTGKKEFGVYPILSYRGNEFVWLSPDMLEETA